MSVETAVKRSVIQSDEDVDLYCFKQVENVAVFCGVSEF
ncbi:hypothetical protein THZG08_10162 [Vibrio owensii]|nr:hypothetical protein THZG08_10162 [Vibrio owensii]CAH1548741.1 hypothetical protein THOA03_10161 [Vibrio owensii]